MAIYICDECGQAIDDDYHPGTESPTSEFELVCDDCFQELEAVSEKKE